MSQACRIHVQQPIKNSSTNGCHSCLGTHFAKLEVRIVVARLLQNYDIQIQNPNIRLAPLYQKYSDFQLIPRSKKEDRK